MNNPLVSVCMITYNHEPFIAEAIEGVLMQQTNFSYELVIGEDQSTDKTRSICEAYASKYPDKVRLLLSAPNMGMNPNFIRTNQAARGKYIALCEGDDYWTDPQKLQKQIDFLETNPEFSFCFHQVQVLRNNTPAEIKPKLPYQSVGISFVLLHQRNPTLSMVFRQSAMPDPYPEWCYTQAPSGDYPLSFFLAKAGKGYFMDKQVMAVYREHSGGIFSVLSKQQKIRKSIFARKLVYKNVRLSAMHKLTLLFAIFAFSVKLLLLKVQILK